MSVMKKVLLFKIHLYGDEIEKALSGLPDDMGKDVSGFLTEICFVDFYTRGGLDIKTRELLVISILVTTGNTNTLKSHIEGNLKVCNTKEDITAAIYSGCCMKFS